MKPEHAREAYRRAIVVSLRERDCGADAWTNSLGDEGAVNDLIIEHHRKCSTAARGWDVPDEPLAAQADALGTVRVSAFRSRLGCVGS